MQKLIVFLAIILVYQVVAESVPVTLANAARKECGLETSKSIQQTMPSARSVVLRLNGGSNVFESLLDEGENGQKLQGQKVM